MFEDVYDGIVSLVKQLFGLLDLLVVLGIVFIVIWNLVETAFSAWTLRRKWPTILLLLINLLSNVFACLVKLIIFFFSERVSLVSATQILTSRRRHALNPLVAKCRSRAVILIEILHTFVLGKVSELS